MPADGPGAPPLAEGWEARSPSADGGILRRRRRRRAAAGGPGVRGCMGPLGD